MFKDKLLEIEDVQNVVIKMQSDIINELFMLLMQYISADELDRLPVVSKINEVARLYEYT